MWPLLRTTLATAVCSGNEAAEVWAVRAAWDQELGRLRTTHNPQLAEARCGQAWSLKQWELACLKLADWILVGLNLLC